VALTVQWPLKETSAVQKKKPGDRIQLTVLRDGSRKEVAFALK